MLCGVLLFKLYATRRLRLSFRTSECCNQSLEMEEKLDMMIAEFRETKRELEQKSLASMNEFK